ncbi:MAG TPA: FG-GAP-like repeat-containing protein [Rhodothermales bacterium]|nr:FG-GAP-like repeat-containing protein [Rhodothermales bacterium]
MHKATIFAFVLFLAASTAFGQSAETEFVFSPEGAELADPFPYGSQNGARGLSGPWDLDGDGQIEVLVAQHNSAGGRVHVIENTGVDTWELVYSTAFIDSSASSSNVRYATGADLDGDGNMEIVTVAGNDYNGSNPALERGVYVWEHDGVAGSDNYGELPATIGNFFAIAGDADGTVRAQNLEAADIDGDGTQELLVPGDGGGDQDIMYVLSVNGTFETDGVGTGFETWQVEARVAPRENGNAYGGGSPYDIIAADLNGDGNLDLSYHTWNNLNFFNATVTGVDAIEFADPAGSNVFLQAAPSDQVGLFGGIAYDIDVDGNDEVFYTNLQSGNLTVIDYDNGEDVLQISDEQVTYDAIPVGGAGGIAVGDIDGDEKPELIVGGNSYSAERYMAGEPSTFIKLAEYRGGDPSDGSNYDIQAIDTSDPVDTTGFHIVYRDSLGTTSQYYETALVKQGTFTSNPSDGIFPSGIAYLGDADGDGNVEIALSFQAVDDSVAVYDEVWNPDPDSSRYDRTVREKLPAASRPFMRIIEIPADLTIAVEDNADVPDGFKLSANYPNPFNPSTTFSFTLPRDANVSVRIYDVTGRLIRTLVDNRLYSSGTYQARWDGTSASGTTVASGTYFYSLEHDGTRQVRPMLLVK